MFSHVVAWHGNREAVSVEVGRFGWLGGGGGGSNPSVYLQQHEEILLNT